MTSSFGNLKGTNLKFPKSVLPVDAMGYNSQGQYTLSENDKRLAVTTQGQGASCASTYYGTMRWNSDGTDVGHKTDYIPVIFDNLGTNIFSISLNPYPCIFGNITERVF